MTAVEDLWPDVRLLRIQLSTFIFSILCSSHPFLSSFIWAAGIKLSAQMVKISLFYQDAPARCGISNADYALPSPHRGWLESIKCSVLSHVATDVAELTHRNAAEKCTRAVALQIEFHWHFQHCFWEFGCTWEEPHKLILCITNPGLDVHILDFYIRLYLFVHKQTSWAYRNSCAVSSGSD